MQTCHWDICLIFVVAEHQNYGKFSFYCKQKLNCLFCLQFLLHPSHSHSRATYVASSPSWEECTIHMASRPMLHRPHVPFQAECANHVALHVRMWKASRPLLHRPYVTSRAECEYCYHRSELFTQHSPILAPHGYVGGCERQICKIPNNNFFYFWSKGWEVTY